MCGPCSICIAPADLKKFRQVADQTSALVRQFKGSLSAEHGVGIARTEYMREQLGEELLGVMREIKRARSIQKTFSIPGKFSMSIICGRRVGKCRDVGASTPSALAQHSARSLPGSTTICAKISLARLELPFQPVLAFAFKDRSFIGNLEQCNGCGGCLKQSGIMCPTFIATHDEVMSTRGRANIIRAALQNCDLKRTRPVEVR